MPTPACLATAVIGAPGSATNTARAESRIRWSLRAASAWRPLIGPRRAGRAFVSVMKMSVASTGTNHSVLLSLEQKILFRWIDWRGRHRGNGRLNRCHQNQKPRTQPARAWTQPARAWTQPARAWTRRPAKSPRQALASRLDGALSRLPPDQWSIEPVRSGAGRVVLRE